jgi:hypothetical protein
VPAAAIVLAGLTGMGALLVEILTETTLQRELDEDVFGRAYGIAFPAAVAGIVVGSVIAPGLAALLGASGALIAVGWHGAGLRAAGHPRRRRRGRRPCIAASHGGPGTRSLKSAAKQPRMTTGGRHDEFSREHRVG